MPDALSLQDAFGEMRDPRGREPGHKLTELLVVAGEAHYVLAVKDNQPGLHEALRELFEAHDGQGLRSVGFAESTDIGKDHGRIETRRCVVTQDIRWLERRERWAGLRSVAMVEATRELAGKRSVERRYYISTLPPDAARIAAAVRGHWAIENCMHWVLGVAFGEDQCRARVHNAAQNFAILRRIVMNLLRADVSVKVGVRNKRFRAGADDLLPRQDPWVAPFLMRLP